MALSNWLTRHEWNTAWIMGAIDGKDNLGDRLIAGMVAMHKAGYRFTGIEIDDNGNYEKIEQCCGDNASVLAEMLTGEFDGLERSKDAVEWAKVNIPTLDVSIVEGWIKEAEESA